jgi:hypothetical protein
MCVLILLVHTHTHTHTHTHSKFAEHQCQALLYNLSPETLTYLHDHIKVVIMISPK